MWFVSKLLAEDLEARIRAHRLLNPPIAWSDELIYPYFDGLSIYNLAQSIAGLLGVPVTAPLDPVVWQNEIPEVDRVVLMISDGFGYRLMQQLCAESQTITKLIHSISHGRGFIPLTSVAPSTTACALPTFWTARPPIASGMLGTSMFLRDLGVLGDMLEFSPVAMNRVPNVFEGWGYPPERVIPVSGLSEQLKAVGVPTHALLDYKLAGTGLSRILHRGLHQFHPHVGSGDMWLRLRDTLYQTRGQKCCVSVYLPNIDSISHAYGHDTEYLRAEALTQFTMLHEILNTLDLHDGRTLFILTADHGHHTVRKVIKILEDPRWNEIVRCFRSTSGGDARFTYLYLREGTRDRVQAMIAERFPEELVTFTPEEAIAAGLFGTDTPHPDLESRLGDLIVVSRLGTRLQDRNNESNSVSSHAGLSDWEMLVPFLYRRI
ncbi:MAG: alkaline phosphatase family protein [Anaerolineae bacterium]|nr:alkaline phosphatase family protein [Anaerolineae bacterium]